MSKKKPDATEPSEKDKGGRPSTFKREYCELLIEHQSRGFSFESFAGKIRVSKQTLYDWKEANAEFLDATLIAKECCRLYWEGEAIAYFSGELSDYDKERLKKIEQDFPNPLDRPSLGPKNFSAHNWRVQMMNRFREEWTDRLDLQHTGADGKPLSAQNITVIIPDNGRNKK